MDAADPPPPPARLVRKSAYGRTQLFLPASGTVMREVKCMGGVAKRETAHVYHLLPDARDAEGACCWHCCEEIPPGAPVVPLPRVHADGVYHVYGRTCSPGCAKAYVLEHTTFDRGQHLNVLVKMLREVYGVEGPVHETPPRPALRRFGGPFDPRSQPRAACRLVEPPFVSYCMLVEERAACEEVPSAPAVEEADTLDEPPPPGLFADYARRRGEESAPPAPKRKRTSPGSSQGPLARFVAQSE